MLLRVVATFVCVWIVAACAPAAIGNELTWTACRDGIDNDLDGRTDCMDSDCRAIPCVESDSGMAEAGSDANLVDASIEVCTPACITGELCRDQRCEIPLPTPLRIEVLSMDGPGRREGFVPSCLDTDREDCGLVGLELVCTGCLPDPYVRVNVESPQPGGGVRTTTLGMTRPAEDTAFASWSDENRWELDRNPVTLEPDDLIFLVAADRDNANSDPSDDALFDCVIKASDLRIGAQRCISKPTFPSQAQKSEYEIWIEVRVPAR